MRAWLGTRFVGVFALLAASGWAALWFPTRVQAETPVFSEISQFAGSVNEFLGFGGDNGCCDTGCCDTGCCDVGCCDEGCAGKAGGKWFVPGERFGLIAATNPCFNNFISPMTSPVLFEDPRTLTEARLIFVHHTVPPELGGGDLQVLALHLRAALTKRLSVIATKDGYVMSDTPLIEDGWADVALGLKYALWMDECEANIVSAGFTYELPFGSERARQGNGDGEWHLFLTGGAELFDVFHLISATGVRLPSDPNAESSLWYWSNHIDAQLTDRLYTFFECNWYNWIDAGNALPVDFEGGDFFNIGASGVAGNNIVTGAIGLKVKPIDRMELGVAWEIPLTDRRDVMDNRLTFDAIIRY